MIIVVDQNIPFAERALGQFGRVVTIPGREITKGSIADAEVLIVRSVTKVDRSLLEGTSIRFVGTATNGVDHIDLDYLQRRNIPFVNAAGTNANAVAQYVIAALLLLRRRGRTPIAGTSLGIVGVGAIGSRLKDYADALGMKTVGYDPPRQLGDSGFAGSGLEAVFNCEVVSLHVPLTERGPYPTHRMVDQAFLGSLRDGAIMINTSRGGVVHSEPLVAWLKKGRGCGVLDVWEGEPSVPSELIELTEIATPHIAGYTLDARIAGTRAMAEGIAGWLGMESNWTGDDCLEPIDADLTIDGGDLDRISERIRTIYDIEGDDRRLRKLLEFDENDRRRGFDQLRRDYPVRREWSLRRQTS